MQIAVAVFLKLFGRSAWCSALYSRWQIRRGHANHSTNAAVFETGKTEAILLSKSRRHWRDRAQETIQVGGHQIGYNRKATRWLGVWIDHRLSFRENTNISAARARKAEARLASFMRRNGVPPLSARHLQEAIVGSTLMYGTEVTWKGQSFMKDSIQKAINRMSRASLGVMRSTPISFLESVGGSMPAGPRLQFRQACYAGRVASSESEKIRDITAGGGELAQRLRASIPGGETQDQSGLDIIVERTFPPGGRRFPGSVHIPSTEPGDDKKQERIEKAVLFAKNFEASDTAYWTDGSAFPGGIAAGAVATFVKKRELLESEVRKTEIVRRGIVGYERHGTERGERRRERTYKEATRSFIRAGNEEGMRAEAWTIRGGATAFDAELSALVRAIELCYLRRAPDVHFRIFTDSQAAMRRILDDSPGPGQAMAIRGIIGATRTCRGGASISVHWVPGHAGVVGNEIADQWALEAATRELGASRGVQSGLIRPDHCLTAMSRSFLRAVLRRRAVDGWREEILSRGRGGRPYRVPAAGEVPRIPRTLQKTRKRQGLWTVGFRRKDQTEQLFNRQAVWRCALHGGHTGILGGNRSRED